MTAAQRARGSTTERGLGHAWRQLCVRGYELYGNRCYAQECDSPGGRAIDPSLPQTSPWSRTMDHLDERQLHGAELPDISRIRPAHRRCNARKGNALRAARQQRHPSSRDWG